MQLHLLHVSQVHLCMCCPVAFFYFAMAALMTILIDNGLLGYLETCKDVLLVASLEQDAFVKSQPYMPNVQVHKLL